MIRDGRRGVGRDVLGGDHDIICVNVSVGIRGVGGIDGFHVHCSWTAAWGGDLSEGLGVVWHASRCGRLLVLVVTEDS